MLKYFIIIELFIMLFIITSTFAIISVAKTNVLSKYPNCHFKPNPNSMAMRIISLISVILKSLIPIYNLLVMCVYLFTWDTLVEKAEEQIIETRLEEN